MNKPILYIFAISHYCEKARWALDYLNTDYELKHIAPGVHQKLAKRLGAPRSSVPILVVDEQFVQGSEQIIDWAESAAGDDHRLKNCEGDRQQCLELNKRLDDIAGVHVRRYYYSEAVVEYPETVRPLFTKGLPVAQKILVRAAWGKMQKLMIKYMDLGREQGEESRRIVEGELDWLDEILSDGREFLVGDQFSRTDIAAASLLAPLALPKQHPTYAGLTVPPRLAADLKRWESRPTLNWVREIYAKYR